MTSEWVRNIVDLSSINGMVQSKDDDVGFGLLEALLHFAFVVLASGGRWILRPLFL